MSWKWIKAGEIEPDKLHKKVIRKLNTEYILRVKFVILFDYG
jgi:hypothetical protein